MQQDILEGFKLSPQQEQLWSLHGGDREHPYRASCALLVEGDLDCGLLEAALRQVVERHEILRTTFRRLAGMEMPLQVIGSEAVAVLRRKDLSDRSAEEQRLWIDAWLDPCAGHSCDVERGPVVISELLTLGPDRSVLLLALPALCADAESLKRLVADLGRCYEARLRGRMGAEEPVQYADIAGWQNELLEAQDTLARKFWQSRGFQRGLDAHLPCEKETGEQGFAPRLLRLVWPADLTRELESLAARCGSSPAMILLSCWHLLLRRLTDRAEVVTGVAHAGRKFDEMQGVVGPLCRYLPLQCEVEERVPFTALVRAVAAGISELHTWQEYFTWRSAGEDEGPARFFAYCFELFTQPSRMRAGAAAFSLERWYACTDRFRLKLACTVSESGLGAELHYDSARFDFADVRRIGEWLRALILAAVEHPEAAIGSFSLLDPEETGRIEALNRTAADLGPVTTLPDLVAAQAARTPDRIAVESAGSQLTFRDLRDRSVRLARHLRRLGVGPEVRVALSVERSLEMVVGLLGILTAGGAYVPIDPAYPADRRRFMMEDARVSLLLTRESLLAGIPAGDRVVCLDRDWPEIVAAEPGAPPAGATADNLAYVIYTSGSTGRPKGVMVAHRAIANRLQWMQRVFPLTGEDRLLQKTPYSFDASLWEIFLPLLSGARLVLAEPGGHQDASYLAATVERAGVTVLQLVPSFLAVFIAEMGHGSSRRALRRLFCGGEALPSELADRCLARLGGELCNLYGPTEAAIDATYHVCAPGEREAVVPIGRPVDNVRIYILDAGQRLVPPGLAGELCIGGTGLARGYLGRPGLTAERFVPDPWSGLAGERLYRTGDLARLGSGGAAEFLGRLDGQVKIRGFRIELGEIENTLQQHPEVRESLVMARESAPGEPRLVAYVVLAPDAAARLDDLRAHLSATLPEHMLPAAWVLLPAFPRLPNGKVDRLALPEPVAGIAGRHDGFVAPRTPAEELLAGVWAELLHSETVGVHDDFFASGGDSLGATQLVSRVRDLFQVDLRVRTLFESPTVAELAERVEAARRAVEGAEAPPLRPVARPGGVPLSFAQQRLWILDRFAPGSAAYNLSVAVRLLGPLDVPALVASLGEIVRRHEVLRTTFSSVDGEPVQRIAPPAGLALPIIDLEALGAAAATEAHRLALADAARPFDLTHGPLFRPLLLKLGEADTALVATLHHIVSDAWSMGLLIDELGRLYRACRAGAPADLPSLPVQYADYAVWQRQWLAGDVLAAEVGYWRQRLQGLPAHLELPVDRPRPAVRGTAGAGRWLLVDERLTRALRRIAREEGATLFMILAGAFEALLARLCGQESFGLGTPIAGRNRLETERLIGFFVNTLVLRADLAGDPSFRELLGRVRTETLDAYAHQDLPFEKLVEELAPERSTAYTPLFQAMVTLQNAPGAEQSLVLPEVSAVPFPIPDTIAKFDLALTLAEAGGALPGSIGYSTDLFDATTIARWAEHFAALLTGISGDPGRRLSELPLLSEPERHQVAHEWNDAADSVFAPSLCLHELFELQAALTPEAVAVRADDGETGRRELTYRELDERANQLAHLLRLRGIGSESLVAICLPRAADLLIALLATLKAGGAYVPLDPEYPRERLTAMLMDAGVAAVLTRDGIFAAPAGLSIIRLDAELDGLALEGRERPAARSLPENLAYVIYTSGSTGTPKGVQIPHSAVVSFLGSMQERLGLGPEDVLLAVTSLSFDISGLELFLPLVTGGRVVIASREVARDGAALAAAVASCGATVLQATPTTWRLLAETGWSAPPGLRRLCGGEALPRELAARLLRDPGDLWNVYGPTETTIWSAALKLQQGTDDVAIGRPLARTGLHVLDHRLEAVPVGVPGELFISGAGLARSYLGRPAQTAEKFVPAPYGSVPGQRWYRTGDMVRWRGNGTLEFLGRLDHQVKVRGFRIELGEIETALEALAPVRQAVVQVTAEGAAEQRLVAFLVPREPRDPRGLAAELRSALEQRLPSIMIPSAFVVLESFPLTPNGKVDRRALLRHIMAVAEPRPGSATPSTPTEEVLAGIWSEVLGVGAIGIDDNFFDLGGHSLLGTRMISLAREAFDVDLPMRALFERPTVAELARRIDAERQAGLALAVPPITPVARGGALPLSFAQQRLWFLDRLEPGNPYYNLPGGFRLTGRLDVAALAGAVAEIVRRHEALHTRFVEVDGQPVQIIDPPAELPLPVADLSSLPTDRRRAEKWRRAAEEARRPFDLASGPLFRVVLLRLAAEEHVVLFNLHHIVGDGWSFGVLAQELAALYRAATSGAAAPLPALPVQYVDFAAWQRQRLQGASLERLLAYWRGRLAGAPQRLELPLDRPRPEVPTFEVGSVQVALPELSEKLLQRSRRQGATLFMTILAALQVLLARLSGQSDVVVGSPIANRTTPELERLIGFFVNTLVLRAELTGNPSFRTLLAQVVDSTLGAYDHQDLPFERLVEELQPERSLASAPLFQVLFVLQNAPTGNFSLPALSFEPLGLERMGTAQLDLTFALAETGGSLAGSWEYNPDVLDATTVRRIAGHFAVLLSALEEGWEGSVADLPLLSAVERQQILVDWNAGAVERRPCCLHDFFFLQAGRTPDAVALIAGRERLTYRELARRSAIWAGALRSLGAGPEVLVGLAMERSAGMVAGALAILAAGAAYVPLDPGHPQERLACLLADSGARLVLTAESLLPRLPPPGDGLPGVVAVDREPAFALAGGVPAAPPQSPVDADHAAYVIYTSGSTGAPKGVVIRHRSAAALVEWALATFPADRLAGVLASTSVCFDLSIFELFVPLAAGGAVILADDALSLPELPAAGEVTLINTVPSAMAELVRAQAVPPSVRTVNLAGEPLRRDLVERVHALPHVAEVYNLYGPSEDTTYSTGTLLARGEAGEPTIGRPLDKARALLLDAALQPVPVGVAGELWLGGAGLARGYLGRPGMTADRFRPDPFAALWREPGGRLYRTGDLGRYLPAGEIEFLGRRDQQVKIRGFRIELGEVEVALSALPEVREAAVLVRSDLPGGDGLVAFVATEEGAALNAAALRERLLRRLPSPLVPGCFVFLDRLPLTPNGKLDRAALARHPFAAATAVAAANAPRTPTEELLAGIFAAVLQRDAVETADDFFALGGHSLLATQVVSRVRGAFGVDLPLRALFERPTVASLAVAVDAAAAAEPGLAPPLAPLPPARPRTGLPLSFAQQRLWFLHRVEPDSPAYNLPTAVHLRGPLVVTALAAALSAIVRRHQVLRTTFGHTAVGEPFQVIGEPMPFHLPVADLRGVPGGLDEAFRLARQEARLPFDLARGPLLRGVLLELGEREHMLLLTMHHIASDGWSLGVLVNELAALYDAAVRGAGSPLPDLALQYADFAAWQQDWLQGRAFDLLVEHWARTLAGAPALLELPGASQRPAVQSGRGAVCNRMISPDLTRDLHALSRRESATFFMTLLAAFEVVLHARTGATDIVVGTDVAGRNRAEVEPLIGFFVNQLVLRTDLGGDPDFRALLARVRETTLGAYAHQDLPFDRLVDALKVPRSLASSPLFQIKLVLQNVPAARLELPDLTLSTVDPGVATAQLDLNLRATESAAGLFLSLQYSTDLYAETAMERLLEQLEEVLGAVAARPEVTLAELAARVRESDRSRWAEREREARGARRERLQALRRPGTGGRPT